MEKLPERIGSQLSSLERAAHRDWIGGRCITLLSHYWRADDPVELTAALGQDWADVLEGMPRDAIQTAAIRWMRENPNRKPTPGHIYDLARESLPKPKSVPKPPEPDRPKLSAERANQIMQEVGFRPKTFE